MDLFNELRALHKRPDKGRDDPRVQAHYASAAKLWEPRLSDILAEIKAEEEAKKAPPIIMPALPKLPLTFFFDAFKTAILKDQEGMYKAIRNYLSVKGKIPTHHIATTDDGEFKLSYVAGIIDHPCNKFAYGQHVEVYVSLLNGSPIYYTGNSKKALQDLCPDEGTVIALRHQIE